MYVYLFSKLFVLKNVTMVEHAHLQKNVLVQEDGEDPIVTFVSI